MQSKKNKSYSGTAFLTEHNDQLVNYNNHIIYKFNAFVNRFNSHPIETVADFGAGIGTLSKLWRKVSGQNPVCIEIDPKQVNVLSLEGFKVLEEISSTSEKFDLVFSSNVLEHIENDRQALIDIRDNLDPKGMLLLYLPAYSLLFSDLDIRVGHYRRYTRKSIKRVLFEAGFRVNHWEYADSIGFFVSLIMKIVGFNGVQKLGGSSPVANYDKYIFPISAKLDSLFFKKLLGKNLFVVATKIERDLD